MMDVFVPAERRGEGEIPFSPNIDVASAELSIGQRLEIGEETDACSDNLDPGSDKCQINGLGDGFTSMGDDHGRSEERQTEPEDGPSRHKK